MASRPAFAEVDKWKAYWEGQTDPRHGIAEGDAMSAYGIELRLLMPEAPGSVLDIGCGTGTLYEPCRFDAVDRYVGVDLASTMLDTFREQYPDVDELVEADGSSFVTDEVFEVVFSNGFLQYLDLDMVESHFRNAKAMMAPGGRTVVASIPVRAMEFNYYGQILRGRISPLPRTIARVIKRRRGSMNGHFHSVRSLNRVAADVGLTVRWHGSHSYPYRLHLVLRNPDDAID